MADTSIRSTHSNISRGTRPESGRLHRKYPYRWLFDQVHVKSLIFHVEVCLLAAAIIGLHKSSQMSGEEHFDPLPIPGFDGLSWSGETFRNYNGVLMRPHYKLARDLINIYSYFLIFSVVTGFMGMRLSETSVARRNFPASLNPAFLLVPSSISVITFMYPLSIWTLRTVHSTIRFLIKDKLKFSIVIDTFRLSFVPVIIVWTIYIYFLYGFWLGVLYYQRRGDQPSPTSNNSPFRRPLRKTSLLRFQGKGVNLLSEAVEISAAGGGGGSATNCALSIPTSSTIITSNTSSSSITNNRSMSPRGYRHLETVDEEAQSRSSD